MDCQKIRLGETNRFTSFFLDYLQQKEQLKPFYQHFPVIENFELQIKEKATFSASNRQVLVDVLKKQYGSMHRHENVQRNIDLLAQNNTYTVTTGHQLNIFGGPLYFIYKIITVINACKNLKQKYPAHNFIPVYWMASEDHDFDEINNVRINKKKITWNTDQKGAVGHFDPASIRDLFEQIPGLPQFFKDAYKAKTLAEAARYYVNSLFEAEGLIVVDGDDKQLKGLFIDVIKDDLFNHSAKALVENTSIGLDALGYKTQIFPREINLFYLKDELRERIEKQGGKYVVVNTDITFSRSELEKEVDNHPERFSPNVVLRPVYQEVILPNLAYVGGPAEVIYWLQLKSTFEHYKISFPMVMPRNFAMVIESPLQRKIEKLGIPYKELFVSKDILLTDLVTRNSSSKIQLNGQLDSLKSLFSEIKAQAEKIDPTLAPHVEAQQTKTRKRLEIIEKKFIRAEKRNQSEKLGQVEAVLEELFPGGGLQERSDNFLNFYRGNEEFIEDLKSCFDPFDYRFHILNYGR